MKKILLSAYIVTWVLLLSACGGGSKTSSLQAEGDTIRMKYSSLLQISGIARNTAFDLLKEWNDHTQTTVEPIPEFSSEEDESTTSSPLHLLLTQALEMLSDREKDILLTYLMYEDGTKYLPGTVLQELCTRHGITADNARQIKSRAMKKLRQQIQLLEMDK